MRTVCGSCRKRKRTHVCYDCGRNLCIECRVTWGKQTVTCSAPCRGWKKGDPR